MLFSDLNLKLSDVSHLRKALLSGEWDTVFQMVAAHPALIRACFIETVSLKSIIDYAIIQNQKEEVFEQLLEYKGLLLKPNLDSLLFMIQNQNWSLINFLLKNNLLAQSYKYQNHYQLSLAELLKDAGGGAHLETIKEPVKEGIYGLYGNAKVLDPIHIPSVADAKQPPIGTQRPKL